MGSHQDVIFHDRHDAGFALAGKLTRYRNRDDVLVLALPRGGVPVAWAVAERLGVQFDIFLVRKVGTPGHEELAMGAIAEGGFRVINQEVVQALQISAIEIERATRQEQIELARRASRYRGQRPFPEMQEKIVILVDDGLATGASMLAAVRGVKAQWPSKCVVAVPVAPPETCRSLLSDADEVVCAVTPQEFQSVGSWYEDFEQVSDDAVVHLLEQAYRSVGAASERNA